MREANIVKSKFSGREIFQISLHFTPLFSLSLSRKRMNVKTKYLPYPLQLRLFAATTAYFSLSPVPSVAACVLSRQPARVFYFHGYHLPSDAAAPPADHSLFSLPALQYYSVRYKGSWPLAFKPDEWYL